MISKMQKYIKKCCDLFRHFGAIYLDFNQNYQIVETFFINLLEHPDNLFDMTSYITDGDNAKTKLRNYVRRVEHCDARYVVDDMYEYDERVFTSEERYKCCIYLKNKLLTTVYDSTKGVEFKAAEKALQILGVE